MLFYKVEGLLINHNLESDDRRVIRENARKICVKTNQFCRKLGCKASYFVANLSDGMITVGIITDRADTVEVKLESYLDHIQCPVKEVTFAEVNLGTIEQLLRQADRGGFIEDDDDIKQQHGIDRISGLHIPFGDNILGDTSKAELTEAAQRYLFQDTFLPEVERIYEGCATKTTSGHPVHYTVQTDDHDVRREVSRLLLQALYANHRLTSRRYTFMDIRPDLDFSTIALDGLYRISHGGAVVLRYQGSEASEDTGFANSIQDTAEQICQIANRHRNRVLTVICLPRECRRVRELFYEHLGGMTFVELQEDLVDKERACSFLKLLAKEHHIRTDKALFAGLEADKGYLASELREIFDTWYNRKLKTTVYPQYRQMCAVGKKTAKAAPKGSAYEELNAMIGLTEAKAVIQKALNYYKIQKLYEAKGLKKDNPAMHMVFTGNPGTAKTTTARLFARIMKDNGLLSRGQLVEVGRGDLVGKYVGWTAKTVQAKFKAAMGGVLFIDEAYSLAEDYSGYGDEAINTIVQEMENHREDVVVIFAGYPKEMERFLQKNPGLRSRIAFHVPFADYTPEELCQIAVLMTKSKGFVLEAEALEKLRDLFGIACRECDFGNGRYVRTVLEQAKMNQASRLLEYDFDDITAEAIRTVKAEDLTVPEAKPTAKRTIGFAC